MGASISYGLAGRRAIVTGHRGGIGAAIHATLTGDGVHVVGLDLPEFDLSDTDDLEPRLAALVAAQGRSTSL
jgi:NAD(P)-dependent dehydrogenase (short-subunit alcohol dehydrogenase family)